MKSVSTFNKFFLLFCAALFILLIIAAPHEKNADVRQPVENVSNGE